MGVTGALRSPGYYRPQLVSLLRRVEREDPREALIGPQPGEVNPLAVHGMVTALATSLTCT